MIPQSGSKDGQSGGYYPSAKPPLTPAFEKFLRQCLCNSRNVSAIV